MTKAFVKETDEAEADQLPCKQPSEYPNYVTPVGLRQLRVRVAALREEHQQLAASDASVVKVRLRQVAGDLRYSLARLESAIPIDLREQPRDVVHFGAVVSTVDEDGVHRDFAIVGEDEAAPRDGKLSWLSPLARELTGCRISDSISWRRLNREVELTVVGIVYPVGPIGGASHE